MKYYLGVTDFIDDDFALEKKAFPNALIDSLQRPSRPLSDYDGILVWHQKIDSQYLKDFSNLKIVVRYGVGFDNVDVEWLRKKNIIFANTPDYGTTEVADTACAMILSHIRKIQIYNFQAKSYKMGWQENTIPGTTRASHQTVGVIGVGRIGTAVIRRLKAFGFTILGYDPFVSKQQCEILGYQHVDTLEEIYAASDIITFHCPDNSFTHHMINKRSLALMKPTVAIINTARGGLIHSLDDLWTFLNTNKMAAIYLDVLPEEPPDWNHPLIRAWKNQDSSIALRFSITPHTAFFSEQSWLDMRYKCAETANHFLTQAVIRNQIC